MDDLDLHIDLDGVILRRTGRTEFGGGWSLKSPPAQWGFSHSYREFHVLLVEQQVPRWQHRGE
jgi:hypothetical protein